MTSFNSKFNKTQLIERGKKLEQELAALRAAPPKTITKTLPAPKGATTRVLDIEALNISLQALQGDVGEAIGSYQSDITSEMSEVLELRRQLDRETADLKELHDIVPNGGSTLGNLINEYNETRETISHTLNARAGKIEDTLLLASDAWDVERDIHDKAVEVHRSERLLSVRRANEEYSYAQAQSREVDEEADAENGRLFAQEIAELNAAAQAQLREREVNIEAQEQSHKDTRGSVEVLREELASALRKAEGEGNGIANRQIAHKAAMVEAEGSAEINGQQIERAALIGEQRDNENTLARLTTQLSDLTASNTLLAREALEARHKGSTQALEVAERIALASASSSKR